MKEYDVIIIGSGSGMSIADTALNHNKDVAIVDKGPIGGTCLNLGCIPSKLLIYPGDVVSIINSSDKLGINSEVNDINFNQIMNRMRKIVNEAQRKQIEGIKKASDLYLYNTKARFVDDYTLEVDDEKISGDMIFLASGARPLIPEIKGLEKIDYLTNENVLELEKKHESIAIIGGGYISAEYSHFFNSMGTKVTIIQRNNFLVPDEEQEVSKKLEEVYNRKMGVLTNTEANEVNKKGDKYVVIGENTKDGEIEEVEVEKVMIAAGRRSNADILEVENTSIDTDERNYVKANRKMETSQENTWVIGDAIGKEMFKHVANREASIAAHNAFHDAEIKMNYDASPHAVFSDPQIASVGLKEKEAKKQYDKILIGTANYNDVAKGEGMMEKDGFAKGLVEAETGKILGFHIIGSFAPILIQEVVNAMANEAKVDSIYRGMHIHPAMPEIITRTFGRLKEV